MNLVMPHTATDQWLTHSHAYGLKIISAILILLVTISASWLPLRHRLKSSKADYFPAAEALASGVFLGASLLHMLPNADNRFEALHLHYPIAFLFAAVVFMFLLWLEHLGSEAVHYQNISKHTLTLLSVMMLSVHSLLAGVALGTSLTAQAAGILLLAILAHKWAASFALAVQAANALYSTRTTFGLFAVFTTMCPMGILLGEYFTHLPSAPLISAIASSLAAGTFLYIGTLHGLDRAVMIHRCCNLREFSLMVLGFGLMAVLAFWI